MTPALRVGTSSFSAAGWGGVFYPEGLEKSAWLTHYATQFDTVELDVTYYRVPDAKLVAGWDAKTPEGFLFAAKFPRSIVHGGEGPRPDPDQVLLPEVMGRDLERFLANMRGLGPKCGPLLLQFPYFNKSVFPGADAFLARLERVLDLLPGDMRFAVEVRNRTWVAEPLLEMLRARNVALAWVDLPYMPHPDRWEGQLDTVTADFLYVRLIGDRKATDALTKTFDRTVIDRSAELDRWAEHLRSTFRKVPQAVAYANNHFAGHGPDTARGLQDRLGEGGDENTD